MQPSLTNLVLAPDAAIDLQVHTVYSDGTWQPEQVIDHLISEQFALVAITDHDRVDTAESLQQLAAAKSLPILVAVEMSARWRGKATDLLCYGFDPEKTALRELANDAARRQSENTRQVFENLQRQGYALPADDLTRILQAPSAQHPLLLADMLIQRGHAADEDSAWQLTEGAGVGFATNELAAIVDAAHQDGAVCLIGHPGRRDGFMCYDAALLDEVRAEAPIDGIEVYYPKHTPEQTAMYAEYAQRHGLLVSSGSDSHGADKPPIKYPARLSRALLERLGVTIR